MGPDASLVAAELVLGRVDEAVAGAIACRGTRYIDDYELCFRTLAEAEDGLAALEHTLSEYELALNPAKTRIIDLPAPLESSWARELRRIKLRPAGSGQRYDIIDFLDAASELRRTFPDEHVLRYAMGALRHVTVLRPNWPILQSLLLQVVAVEPGILPYVLRELIRYERLGYSIDSARLAETLTLIITQHGPLGRGSEVAWACWGHVVFDLQFDDSALSTVEEMDDPVPILVVLDAEQRGLLPRPAASMVWANVMSQSGLLGAEWLLAYEAAAKGWLPGGYLARDADFDAMRTNGVEFYRVLTRPRQAPIQTGPIAAGY